MPVHAASDSAVLRGQSPPVVPHAVPVIARHRLMSFNCGFLLSCFKKKKGGQLLSHSDDHGQCQIPDSLADLLMRLLSAFSVTIAEKNKLVSMLIRVILV